MCRWFDSALGHHKIPSLKVPEMPVCEAPLKSNSVCKTLHMAPLGTCTKDADQRGETSRLSGHLLSNLVLALLLFA